MLTALIRISNPPSASKIKAQGDIIVVKKNTSPWGREEIRRLQRILFQDAALEAIIDARIAQGEVNPVIPLPYAEFNPDGSVKVYSTKVLDIALVPASYKANWNNNAVVKGVIPLIDAPIRDKTAAEKP